jgi:hypothetical protein
MTAARRSAGGESGSLTAPLLLAILALSALAAAAAATAGTSLRGGASRPLPPDPAPVAQRVIQLLEADPTPDADGPLDPAALEAAAIPVGNRGDATVEVSLTDASSAVDPNWVDRTILEETNLGRILLAPGVGVDALQRYRAQAGLGADAAAHYRDLFGPEALAGYLTSFQPASVNTADELALEQLFRQVAPEGDAAGFRSRLRDARTARHRVEPAEIAALLGTTAPAVLSSVTASPVWNVHYLPELLLRETVRARPFGIAEPDAVAAAVLAARERREISPEELPGILGVATGNRILAYLGTVTWFWRATWVQDGWRTEVVIARNTLPDGSRAFSVVSILQRRTDRGRT